MSLDSLINIQITKQSAVTSKVGFGTPMIMSAEASVDSRFVETAKTYTKLDELGATGDNYDTTGPTYLMAKTLFSQNPQVKQVVVGKRTNLPLMTVELTPIVADNTDYVVTIGGEIFTFNSGAGATATSINAGLLALINVGAQNVLAAGTLVLKIEKAVTPGGAATAGKTFTIVFDRTRFDGQNITADPGIAADIASIRGNLDGDDDWYLALLDSFGLAEITTMSSEIEALFKAYFGTTFDADVLTASTTDIGSVLQGTNAAQTMLQWHETPLLADLSAMWAGANLPKDAGSITWMFKHGVGPAVSKLTSAEIGYLTAKSVNHYIEPIVGSPMMQNGVTSSGEFFDVTRGLHFVAARMKEALFAPLYALPKVEFEDSGIAIMEARVQGVLALAVSQKIFAANPAPTTTAPLEADISDADKANRILDGIDWAAKLSGAIHKVDKVTGNVSV